MYVHHGMGILHGLQHEASIEAMGIKRTKLIPLKRKNSIMQLIGLVVNDNSIEQKSLSTQVFFIVGGKRF